MIVKKGQVIAFSEGEYSRYRIESLATVIKEFNLKEKQAEWELEHTELEKPTLRPQTRRVKGTDFLPWLISQGLIQGEDCIEVHMGTYGNVEIYITTSF